MSVDSIINAHGIQRLSQRELWLLANRIADLGLSPDCVAVVLSIESGFDARALNKYSGASGLLQVMPSLTKVYGYPSASAIRTASAEEQIKRIVVAHYKKYVSVLKGQQDCGAYYLAVFLPGFLGKPDSLVVGEKDSSEIAFGKTTRGAVYKQNFGFDTNHDGVFTVGDIKNLARSIAAQDAKLPRVRVPASLPPKSIEVPWVQVGLAAVAGALIYTLVRRPVL